MDRKWNAENQMHILYYIQNPRAQKSEICFTWGTGMQKLNKHGPWSLELQKKSGEKLEGKNPDRGYKGKNGRGPRKPTRKV